MSNWTPLSRERHFPPAPLTVLLRLLEEECVDAEAVLADTGVSVAELADVACLISQEQYLIGCRNALALSRSASLAMQLGRAQHLPDLGMLGLMLLSCVSVSDFFRLATKFQAMTVSALSIQAQLSGPGPLWIISDVLVRELPQAVRRFLVEQQFVQLLTQVQDLLGPGCVPALACFAHPAPAHHAAVSTHLQCPVLFDCRRNELHFDAAILTRKPRLANAFTSASLQAACEGHMAEIEASSGLAGRVYRALRALPGAGAGMQAVASTLKMTDRTLRRYLADEGTSFSIIADEVRCSVARQQLQRPELRIEDVAELTGFSDTANFRRAFMRWTGTTPAQFRQSHHRGSREPSSARSQASLSPVP